MNKKFHIYSNPLFFECIYPLPHLQIQIFSPSSFVFLLSQIIPVYTESLLMTLLLVLWPFMFLFQVE